MPVVPTNYWAVLAAAALNIILGILWYGPFFGKPWKAMMGFSDEAMKKMPLTAKQAMVGGLITALLLSYALHHAIIFASAYLKVAGLWAGLMVGFFNWLGFLLPFTLGGTLWEGKPWRLTMLNASYWLVALLGMGTILALWP